MRILFVCTGNICRSPMAEYIARREIERRGLDITVSGAGMCLDGYPASENAVAVCREIGLDITAHRSRIIDKAMADQADLIVVMTEEHAERLRRMGVEAEKVKILGGGIPDPYHLPIEVYRCCRDDIEKAVIELFDALRPPVVLKPLAVEDAAELAELEKVCFSDPWSESGIAYEATNKAARFFVAWCGEEIAGYAGMFFAAGYGEMCNLAVYPRFRRRGIGRLLMDKLIGLCDELEIKELSLEVRATNTAAIALYSSLGFEQVGLRPKYYSSPTEDALIMNLKNIDKH